MFTRQQFMSIGGPGAFVLPPAEVFLLTSAPDGAWAEPQRSKAVYHGGYTYLGYVDSTSGDVEVVPVPNLTRTAGTSYVLHAALGGEGTSDMHDNPGLWVRPSDHKLLVAYCRHAGNTVYLRVSTNSLDTDPTLSGGFAAEASLDAQLGGVKYDYPAFVYLSASATLYLFVRDIPSGSVDAHLKYATSTDGGATWSSLTDLYNNPGKTTYWNVNGNDVDQVHVLTFDDNEGAVTNNLLKHFYLTSGGRFQTDGSAITAELPLAPADIDTIPSTAGHHLFGIEIDVSNRPGFTVSARVSGSHYVRRGQWNGSTWDVTDICTSPGTGGIASGPYSWGNVIDPDDFNHALVSRWIDGEASLWDYRYSDGSWSGSEISAGGGLDWVWPTFVRDGAANLRAAVLYGTYTGYTDPNYSFSIYGLQV